MLIGIVTCAYKQFAIYIANNLQTKNNLPLYSIKLAIFIITVFELAFYASNCRVSININLKQIYDCNTAFTFCLCSESQTIVLIINHL